MNLRWGVSPFRVDFTENPEDNVTRTFKVGRVTVGSLANLALAGLPISKCSLQRSLRL